MVRLATQDGTERSAAIRRLLRQPLILRRQDEDLFRTIAVHRTFLTNWFEEATGWRLQVDVRAGVARLHKRTALPDPHRGLVRRRSAARAFDARRYQMLSLACAELLARPHTTLGELADAIARAGTADDRLIAIDMTKQAQRYAFVDGLLWLQQIGALDVTAGELERYGDVDDADAVLVADTTLLPMLLSSELAPSRIDATSPAAPTWIDTLRAEPRYGTAASDPAGTPPDQRERWARHYAIRRLLDDPVVELARLPLAVREYLATPAGRDKALAAAADAGLAVERHADVWLAIDDSKESTIGTFSSPMHPSTVEQAAAIVLELLVPRDDVGNRELIQRSTDALAAALARRLTENPHWARRFQTRDGAVVLLAHALGRLEEFGLVAVDSGVVTPRAAAARFEVCIDEETPQ